MQLEGCNRPKDLARCCGLTTGGMTVVLDRLEKAGYIKREPNPDDRRSLLIRGIPAKTRKLEAIYRSKGELLAGVVSRYNEGELELILDFFTRCNRSNSSPE
jgi:DNA-binding MarR family transcriptional regulator